MILAPWKYLLKAGALRLYAPSIREFLPSGLIRRLIVCVRVKVAGLAPLREGEV